MSEADWDDFQRGVALFSTGRYWHAHEAWESVWRRHRAHPAQAFFKGLIQLAAAHHQRERGRWSGMLTHLERVSTRLRPFASGFLGVDVDAILRDVDARRQAAEAAAHGPPVGREPTVPPAITWRDPRR